MAGEDAGIEVGASKGQDFINEEIVITPQRFANAIDSSGRWERLQQLAKDPKVKEGVVAFGRTLANAGITLADTVPAVGDAVSWGADFFKVVSPVMEKIGISTDLSPDVSKKAALGSEAVEFVTAGLFPSHIVETIGQLKADIPRMKEAIQSAKEILKYEKQDYTENKNEIDEAMKTFGVSSPSV